MTWRHLAACADTPTAVFYPEPEAPNGRPPKGVNRQNYYAHARAICNQCPVKDRCLNDAMATEDGLRSGMFGGLTPRERASLPWRICTECGQRFSVRRIGKGGSIPKLCGQECRDAVRQRRYDAERLARLGETAA